MTGNWQFKDEREDIITFPQGLTRDQRREFVRNELERYKQMKAESVSDILESLGRSFENGTLTKIELNLPPISHTSGAREMIEKYNDIIVRAHACQTPGILMTPEDARKYGLLEDDE